jgi:hypothetical protein
MTKPLDSGSRGRLLEVLPFDLRQAVDQVDDVRPEHTGIVHQVELLEELHAVRVDLAGRHLASGELGELREGEGVLFQAGQLLGQRGKAHGHDFLLSARLTKLYNMNFDLSSFRNLIIQSYFFFEGKRRPFFSGAAAKISLAFLSVISLGSISLGILAFFLPSVT